VVILTQQQLLCFLHPLVQVILRTSVDKLCHPTCDDIEQDLCRLCLSQGKVYTS
jgi:hypothetical protein